MNSKSWIWILLLLLLVSGAYYLYKQVTGTSTHSTYTYAYVRSDVAEKADVLYKQYETAQLTYRNMKAQYKAEKEMRQWLATKRQRDSIPSQALNSSYGTAYDAKVAVKVQENNAKLMEAYDYYVHKYGDVWGVKPKETDLRIVTLQLELLSLQLSKSLKEQKEKELQSLLQGRSPSLETNDKELREKVLAAVDPLKVKLDKELAAYSIAVRNDLNALRTEQFTLGEEYNRLGLTPMDQAKWEDLWQQKLMKQEEIAKQLAKTIHRRIEEKGKAIAKAKGLTYVSFDKAPKDKSEDITEDVMAQLKVRKPHQN